MELRENNLNKLRDGEFDVLVVGGGINGAVSAASLAARGARVALIDRGDFAGETSSNSSNLAWGGIKYLEGHEYSLVNKLCRSRNHLMDSYPSTVQELRFITTIQRGFRYHPLFIYLGALLYWFIGRCKTRAPRYLSANAIEGREPIIDTSNSPGGLEYSDCYLHDNDARFVFNFVRASLNYGCIAANYVDCEHLQRENGVWRAQLSDVESGDRFELSAKVLINACGPGVDSLNEMAGVSTRHRHVFSKGVHLVVDKLADTDRVLTFFASDGRLFFVIPMGPRSCIGTTDTPVESADQNVSDEDRRFILDNVNSLLDVSPGLGLEDIIAERCGVRPLAVENDDEQGDWLQMSRKHIIELDSDQRHLSIFGGKLTDCLNVGNEVAVEVAGLGINLPYFDKRWYGEPDGSIREEFFHRARLLGLDEMTDPSSSEPLTTRLWRRYGRNAIHMLESIRQDPAEAELLIERAEYLRCEIEHAAQREMITRLEDFLRRRSKIEQVITRENVVSAPGLRDACCILFGERADEKLQEYMRSLDSRH